MNTSSRFEGIWVPIVTPFIEGRLDLPAAQKLALHLKEQGIAGIAICGTTGEASSLSRQEQAQLLAAIAEAVGPDYPLAFGLSGNNTAEMTAAAASLTNAPVAALLISAPYYVRPSQEGIRLHYEAVAAATPHPVILYNIPYRTGVNIEPATAQSLARNPQFVAIKESNGGNMEQTAALINDTPLKVLAGDDPYIYLTACLGGHGAISAAAHLRPDLYVRMLRQVQAGELAAARAIANQLRPLIRHLFSEPNPAVIKAALAMQGWIKEGVRLPMVRASAAGRDTLAALLDQVHAI